MTHFRTRHLKCVIMTQCVVMTRKKCVMRHENELRHYQIWTNVCRKEDMGIVDNIALLVFGSRTCSAQSAPKHTYQQFKVAKSKGLRWKSA